MSGEKYRILCSPYIKVKELIAYFLESLNSNNYNAINESNWKLLFLFGAEKIDINSSMLLNKRGIIDESNIIILENYGVNPKRVEKPIYLEKPLSFKKEWKFSKDYNTDDWTLIFENQDDGKHFNIKISCQKLVKDAISEYYRQSGRSEKCSFIFNYNELLFNEKICKSGMENFSRILVVSADNNENLKLNNNDDKSNQKENSYPNLINIEFHLFELMED